MKLTLLVSSISSPASPPPPSVVGKVEVGREVPDIVTWGWVLVSSGGDDKVVKVKERKGPNEGRTVEK